MATLPVRGQYEHMQRAQEKMKLVIPATLAIIFLLLYFNFKGVGETAHRHAVTPGGAPRVTSSTAPQTDT